MHKEETGAALDLSRQESESIQRSYFSHGGIAHGGFCIRFEHFVIKVSFQVNTPDLKEFGSSRVARFEIIPTKMEPALIAFVAIDPHFSQC